MTLGMKACQKASLFSLHNIVDKYSSKLDQDVLTRQKLSLDGKDVKKGGAHHGIERFVEAEGLGWLAENTSLEGGVAWTERLSEARENIPPPPAEQV